MGTKRSDFSAFLASAGNHWIGLLTGGVCAAVLVVIASFGFNVPPEISVPYCFTFLIVLAAYFAFKDQKQVVLLQEEMYERRLSDLRLKVSSEELKQTQKDVLGKSIQLMLNRLREIQEIDPYSKTVEEMNKEHDECERVAIQVGEFMKALGEAEHAYYSSTETRKYQVHCWVEIFYQQCSKQAYLESALKSRIAALQVLLEKRM